MKYLRILSFMVAFALGAAPKAVVFDWGNVIACELDRSYVVDFMCKTFSLSQAEFELINLEKRIAMLAGKSDVDFWLEYAEKKNVQLPPDWADAYAAVIKASVGVDPNMVALIDELKDQRMRIGLLSNIPHRYAKLLRSHGFYEPFNPCLLSCEIGHDKPDLKAYELLLKTIKLSAEEIVFIDDKLENVDAAKKLGIDAFVFQSAEQVRDELKKRGLIFNHDAQMDQKG